MKIKQLALHHFRCFTHIEIPFHEQLTVLVAKNGAGKTSILDGLAITLDAVLTRLPSISGLKSQRHPPSNETRCQCVSLTKV